MADTTDGAGGAGGDRLITLAAFNTRGLNLADTISITYPPAAEHHIAIDEYTGVKAVDTTVTATGTTATGFNPGTLTAAHAGEMLIATSGIQKTATPAITTTGYTTLPILQVPTGQQPDMLIDGYEQAGAAGPYTATGTSTGVWLAQLTALVPNVVTAALTAAPTAGLAPLPVTFDAGKSSPGRNPITSYQFDYGDGTTPVSGTATTTSHTYTTAGTYTAKLTVTDGTAATDTATTPITVTAAQKPLTDNGMVASDGNLAANTTPVSTTGITLGLTSAIPAGDTLVVPMMLTSSDPVNTGSITATDTQGNTYTQIGTPTSDGSDFVTALAAVNITHPLSAADTITVTWPNNTEHNIAVEDFSGVTAIDQVALTNGTLSAQGPFGSGTVVTGAANELLYGFTGIQGGQDGRWDTGWTANYNGIIYANTSDQLLTASQAVTTTGTYQASGTAFATWMAGIITMR